ncbi:MAG: erythromycin esterase family protein, partial [Pseudobdellovibrionaceae bacterium]
MVHFQNRTEAGVILADKLSHLKEEIKKEKPLVLAIPRGGVPVAFEVAKKLHADLDLLIVKKIGAPDNPELAIGAISEEGAPWLNNNLIDYYGITAKEMEPLINEKLAEVKNLAFQLRGSHAAIPVEGRTLIIVDDGIATGATLRVAIQFLRQRNPKKIIIAVPVAPEATLEPLRQLADEVICLETPSPFIAVGEWYRDFSQVSEGEVLNLLHSPQMARAPLSQEIVYYDGMTELRADLQLVEETKALIVFAHESGGNRHSPGNRFVAKELNKIGFSTLLVDLLTEKETQDRENVFNIELAIDRLLKASEAGFAHLTQAKIPLGYFGANTGAAAVLGAAAKSSRSICAIVSRGGRPDLVNKYLRRVKAPTLLIVGGEDPEVTAFNELAAERLAVSQMVLIPQATHSFAEPEVLEEVVEYAADWFLKYAPLAKTSAPPKENIVREMEERAHPIGGEGAWQELIERVAKSRIVMLGEASHGTAEFYSVRRMISEKLIQDHGFDFIAVEGDWPDCQKLNEYIHGGGKSAMDVMRQFQRWPTWMWANEEVASLIEWMQNYQAGFYGLDVYSLFDSLDYVQTHLKSINPELAQEVRKAYSCFEPFERNEKAYVQHLLKFEEGCRKEVVESLGKILRLRLTDLEVKEGELFSAQQNARIVKNAEEYYRAMLTGGAESWNVRDQH